ncbi:MAG TPA: bifunctional 23S rRNA (guanine(2069)-N(7))-methyltransferase RlmK/23S rRNA (guanine(2445)-N(2))-methyltransferase RlmL [Oleiagrimonas sp.]|nr:bifunctional 23S rRNA (guanine(2069)-N(7))-methyltransferase RlmK/23S rRNA (guanine(2445)-N(2))-methyltransferase RlmL [Oleiagrimonas sp.]
MNDVVSDSRAFFATCPKGLEYLLRDELVALGAGDVHEARAGVHFSGQLVDAYRACLWSRLASRVLMPLASFDAGDDAALYAGVQSVDWSRHLALDGTLAVSATLAAGSKGHSRFIAQRVKDAVVDQFRERAQARPDVDPDTPDIRIHLHVGRQRTDVSLDLAGTPLHRRGWRDRQGQAPLKENLAAAMLLRARWLEAYAAGGVLVDPMCGSGTLLIEGAWMAADVAPGLDRDYFGFLGWRGHDVDAWDDLREDARTRADAGLRTLRAAFFGSDVDPHMVQVAKHNAQLAGVAGFVQLERRDVAHLKAPHGADTGLVITNPPYGERLGERADMPALYRVLGDTLRNEFVGWQAALLVGEAALGHATGLRAHKQYALYNGALKTPLLLFNLAETEQAAREPRPLSDGAQMVANRLRKNERRLRKRLARENIHCWRAYDRDLPEYAAAVDVYAATDGTTYLHVQEYRAPRDIPVQVARTRLHELVRAAGEAFDVPRERVAVKRRERGKGGSKYGVMDRRGELVEVEEGGLKFLVNLFDYLDTGLFPDHRLVRERIREMARGRRFLNLFAYTASASVYAAAGGARATTSVDLSTTYLEWASRNLERNGFTGRAHTLARADAMDFLRDTHGTYGLIYVDPPTFSNSSRASDFDVQRDHVALLEACASHLEPGGVIVFSNNFRRFKLDDEALSNTFEIVDWSDSSIPFDYARHADIHGCWLLQLK